MASPADFYQATQMLGPEHQKQSAERVPSGRRVIGGEHLSTPDRPVGNLPVYVDDEGAFWSCWTFDEEELARIAEHGCIFVGVVRPVTFPVLAVLAPDHISRLEEGT